MFQLPEEIPYQSGNRNEGFLYEDKVILYAAASLSQNDAVDDFWLVSNPVGIDSFDDVVLRISLKNGDNIAVFVQVKLTDKPLMLIKNKASKIKCKEINLAQYKNHADLIINSKNCNDVFFHDVFKDVDLENHYFCIFSSSKEVYPRLQTKELDGHPIQFMDASKNNQYLQFDHTNKSYEHIFYRQLYILLSQPNVTNLDSVLTSTLGEYFIPKKIAELCKSIEKYRIVGNNTIPLRKNTFETLCLEVLLDNWVLTDIPQVGEIDKKYIKMWLEIFATEHVINFHEFDKICPLLGYLFQEQIREKIDATFSWHDGITDSIKASVAKKYQRTVTDKKDLMFLMWQEEHLPLAVKPKYTKEFLTVLNRYHHLNKRFLIFSDTNVNIRFQNDTKVINCVAQISSQAAAKDIVDVDISLQGRSPVSLSTATCSIFAVQQMVQKNFEVAQKITKVWETITISKLLSWTTSRTDHNQRYHSLGQVLKETDEYYIKRKLIQRNDDIEDVNFPVDEHILHHLRFSLITIYSEPGMGKSELLQALAYNYPPDKFVVYVNLRDCDDDLASDDEQIASDPITYFFSKANQNSDHLLNSIFDAHKVSNALAIFIDGFDEILPEHRYKIKGMIENIMRDNKIQIFLATRTQSVNDLPTTCATMFLNLLPFTNQDVIRYCNVREVPTDILAKLDQSMVNNPLQLNMITSLYKDHVTIKSSDRADIYKTFIDQKHSLYYKKETINRNTANMISKLSQEFHRKLALIDTFGEESAISNGVIHAYEPETILEFIKDQNLGLALVSKSKQHIHFVHKSYADFLLALWLHENKKFENKFANIYRMIVENSHYRDIYCFFNEISCNLTAHKAAILGDTNMLKKLLNSLDSSIFQEDEFGRNIAHILAWYGQFSDVHHNLYKQLIGSHIASSFLYRKDSILKGTNKYFERGSNYTNNNNFDQLKRIELSDNYFTTNPEALNESIGTIALHCSIMKGDIAMVQPILKNFNLLQTDTNGNNALHISCASGHLNITQLILAKLCEVDNRNAQGETALHSAARQGIVVTDIKTYDDVVTSASSERYFQIVKLLLDKGANPHAVNCDGNNAIHFAAQYGNLRIVEEILDKDVAPSIQNNNGWTPLHLAASHGHIKVIQLLLTKKVDVNIENNTGSTAVIEAAIAGHMEIVKFLISNGADLKPHNSNGWTCLHVIASQGNLEIAEMLVSTGIDVNQENNDKRTPLIEAYRAGYSHIAEYLLNNSADPNQSDKNGWNCLHIAADRGDLEMLKLLVTKGININQKNNDGNTALILASKDGHYDVVDFLLKNGADILQSDKHGFSALHFAACKGHLEIVKLLVTGGGDINHKAKYDITPMTMAYIEGHVHVGAFLLGIAGADGWIQLMEITGSGELPKLFNTGFRNKPYIREDINYPIALEQLKLYIQLLHRYCLPFIEDEFDDVFHFSQKTAYLLKQGCMFRPIDHLSIEEQAMHFAAERGILEIMQLLVTEGTDLNAQSKQGYTAINVASALGHLHIVEFIINTDGNSLLNTDEDGWNSLHFTSKNGHLDLVELLLAKGMDVNHRTNEGKTAMCLASEFGHLGVVECLLKNDGDPLLIDKDGAIPLHYAAQNGHLGIVELLVTKGIDVNFKTNYGATAMIVAAESGHLKIVEFLLNKNANPLQHNNDGATPFHYAAKNGHLDIVKLLSKSINVNHKTNLGDTAIGLASASGHYHVVEFLLNIDGDPSQEDDNGENSLHHSAYNGHLDIVKLLLTKGINVNHTTSSDYSAMGLASQCGHYNIVKYLLDIDSDPLKGDKDGAISLHYAANNGHLDIVKLLLAKGVDANHKTNDGTTAMGLSSASGHFKIVEYLISRDANPLQADEDGWTPLHFASYGGHTDIVKLLLRSGVDVNQKTNSGITAMCLASIHGHLQVVEYLLNIGGDPIQANQEGSVTLHYAAKNGHVKIVELLSTRGIDVDQKTNYGRTAMSLACEYGHLNVVEFLINVDGDPMQADESGWTSFHFAAKNGQVAIVELLVSNGIDPNHKTNSGATAMCVASAFGQNNVLECLLNVDADPLQSDKDGWISFHYAANNGHFDIVKLLLAKGIDVDHRTNKGRTAMSLASASGKFEIVEFLVEANGDPLLTDEDGLSSLHYATANEHLDIVELLTKKALVANNDGITVYSAPPPGNFKIIELMINLGGSPLHVDKNGWTFLHHAAHMGHTDTAEMLLTNGVDVNLRTNDGFSAICLASMSGHLNIVELLINADGDPLLSDDHGFTPLHYAAGNGQLGVVELLLRTGIDVNHTTNDGRSAICLASKFGYLDIVAFLMNAEANPLQANKDGWIPLHYAADKGHLAIIKLLITKGTDVKRRTNDGSSAMSLASASGHLNVVDFLNTMILEEL